MNHTSTPHQKKLHVACIYGVIAGLLYSLLSFIPAFLTFAAINNSFSVLSGAEDSFSLFSIITIVFLGMFTYVSFILFVPIASWCTFFMLPKSYKKEIHGVQNFTFVSTAYFIGILIIGMIFLHSDIQTIVMNTLINGLLFWIITRLVSKKYRCL